MGRVWLPSQSCTEVRPTAARCQDGVWRRTWFPTVGLPLERASAAEPVGRLFYSKCRREATFLERFLALFLVSHWSQAHSSQMFEISALGSFTLVKELCKERKYFTPMQRADMPRAPLEVPQPASPRRGHP